MCYRLNVFGYIRSAHGYIQGNTCACRKPINIFVILPKNSEISIYIALLYHKECKKEMFLWFYF
jgi:hypothetical protein